MPKILSSRLRQVPHRRWARLRALGLEYVKTESLYTPLVGPQSSTKLKESTKFQAPIECKYGAVEKTGQYSTGVRRGDAFNSRGRTIYNVFAQRKWQTPFSTESQSGFNCSGRSGGRRKSYSPGAKLGLMGKGMSIHSICPAYFEKRISARQFLQLHTVEEERSILDLFLDSKDIIKREEEIEYEDYYMLSSNGGSSSSSSRVEYDFEYIEMAADVMFKMFINYE